MTTPPRRFKDAIYEQFARLAKAFANPHRFELLSLLAQSPRTVESLAEQAGMSLANTSQHLQRLRAAGLVEAEKEGLFVTYRLASEQVGEALLSLQQLARARLAEVERLQRELLDAREAMEPVNREALLARVRSGEVFVLDVRPEEEYRAGHLPGALCIPLDALERRLAEIPKDREVVAYCRGPYCVFALEAVSLLRAHGFRSLRLAEGPLEWKAQGFPLEVSDL